LRTLVLSGGTGSAKLLRGLKAALPDFTVIANVGDNFWFHALYVCPDVDTALYALSGKLDRRRGWGVAHETFNMLRQFSRLGEETWFQIGDKDLALHVLRSELLRKGMTLTEITRLLARRMRVKIPVLPPTDTHMETHIITVRGEIHLQEFWVKRKARDKVSGVKYIGSEIAQVTKETLESMKSAERIILCPANPVTSIGPILAVKGVREALQASKAKRIAVSPMVGNRPYSGPSAKLMRALGIESNSYGVAKLYSSVIDTIVIDKHDPGMLGRIRGLGLSCIQTQTFMRTREDERELARFLLRI
jgi:LPPG:FO 2-phospho-L-lactate transferase